MEEWYILQALDIVCLSDVYHSQTLTFAHGYGVAPRTHVGYRHDRNGQCAAESLKKHEHFAEPLPVQVTG